MMQENEPTYFRTEFHKRTGGLYPIIHGGGASCGDFGCSNYVVKNDEKYNPDKSLFRVRIVGGEESTADAIDIPKQCSSVNSQDCFVLLMDGLAYLWMGKFSTDTERDIAFKVAGKIAGDALAVIKMLEGENEVDQFWDVLGGKGEYSATRPLEVGTIGTDGKLFLAEGWKWKEIGTEYSKDNLDESTVAVLDAGSNDTFVWVGSKKVESTGLFYKAVECLDSIDVDNSETRPVMVVTEGFEHEAFTSVFRGWCEPKTGEDANAGAEEKAQIVTEVVKAAAQDEVDSEPEEVDAQLKADEDARAAAADEARLKTEGEAKAAADEVAKAAAEDEANLKAKEDANIAAEDEAKLRQKRRLY